ncbi:MAG TPA: hypothetical protein P5328_01895 [Candidatus Paceibacterota bacterium]|nr:hypothetical protein [Candidatus Paceibacterota bacterium]HRZ34494.1 hypothetical protein [Candidatus Paceibacterota bacterium]
MNLLIADIAAWMKEKGLIGLHFDTTVEDGVYVYHVYVHGRVSAVRGDDYQSNIEAVVFWHKPGRPLNADQIASSLSPGTRKKILDELEELQAANRLDACDQIAYTEAFEFKLQERVMDDYREKCMVVGQRDEEALHMFFSPARVVAGLTDREVRLCILMSSLRDQQKRLFPLMRPPMLSEKLLRFPDISLPRGEALKEAIYDILLDIAESQILPF